jgi:hypothetical protein
MKPLNVALLIVLDLATLLTVLLVLSYHGMSHLLIFLLGLLLLLAVLYDFQSGRLSALFSDFLGLNGSDELGRIKWLPVILALLLLVLSLPVLLEHGFVNDAQRWAMQDGRFIRVALPAATGGVAVIIIAVWTILSGSKNNK